MIVVGVTGSLCSGKNAVAAIFKKMGAKIFDADICAKKVTRKGTAVHRAITQIFGREYLGKKGALDRGKLAWRVFSSPRDLRKLNILVHPEVIIEAFGMIKHYKGDRGVLVLNVPLLYESRMEKMANVVVVVRASQKTMMRRAAKKGVRPALAKKILASQWPAVKKARRADFVIENNGTLTELQKKAGDVYQAIVTRHVLV